MGLDISHDTWTGAYSSFHRWREKIAEIAGFPPLMLMEGFYSEDNVFLGAKTGFRLEVIRKTLPIKWNILMYDPLWILLSHSDCDGTIEPEDAQKIAERLKDILPLLPTGEDSGHIRNWKDTTQRFITGCECASKAGERLEFH